MNRNRDAGRVSLMLAVAQFGLLAIIGLSYDGAGQLRALHRANNLAAEAARAGGQEIDVEAAIGGGPKRLDPEAATAAVNSYRAAAGVTGPPALIQGNPPEQTITVIVHLTYQPIMLSFFGVQPVQIQGAATARPLTDDTQ